MVQWEYKVETIYSNMGEIEKKLNERGVDGWELVWIKQVGSGGSTMMIFKRMK